MWAYGGIENEIQPNFTWFIGGPIFTHYNSVFPPQYCAGTCRETGMCCKATVKSTKNITLFCENSPPRNFRLPVSLMEQMFYEYHFTIYTCILKALFVSFICFKQSPSRSYPLIIVGSLLTKLQTLLYHEQEKSRNKLLVRIIDKNIKFQVIEECGCIPCGWS